MADDYDLDRAYQIHGPEDARALYRRWAASYDQEFGSGWGYIAPREIAWLWVSERREGDEPLLDIGAGTGLVAEHLERVTVDAIDITPEMLARAAAKGLYRQRHLGDLTKPLAFADASYGGVISCGTFTHGHVGPECLPELLRVTRPGALFCCGTIAPVMDGAGFGSALARLVATRWIEPVRFREIAIYDNDEHHHGADRGLVMVFRTLRGGCLRGGACFRLACGNLASAPLLRPMAHALARPAHWCAVAPPPPPCTALRALRAGGGGGGGGLPRDELGRRKAPERSRNSGRRLRRGGASRR